MNGIRTQDRPARAWLQVTKGGSPRPGYINMRAELFDGTPFEFAIPELEYEDQGPDCPPLVEVGLVGNVGNKPSTGIVEIILPTPVLTLGHNVRVSEQSILRWDVYHKIQEKNKSTKGKR